MSLHGCVSVCLRLNRVASRLVTPKRTITSSASGRPEASGRSGNGKFSGSTPSKWTGASVLAIATAAGAAGWAMASLGGELGFPDLRWLPKRQKILLDAGRTPRFANIRDMERVRGTTHEGQSYRGAQEARALTMRFPGLSH